MDVTFPEVRLNKPVCGGITQEPFGLFADKAKLKRLGISFPDDSVNGINQGLITLLRLLLLLSYRGSPQLSLHGRKQSVQFLSSETFMEASPNRCKSSIPLQIFC